MEYSTLLYNPFPLFYVELLRFLQIKMDCRLFMETVPFFLNCVTLPAESAGGFPLIKFGICWCQTLLPRYNWFQRPKIPIIQTQQTNKQICRYPMSSTFQQTKKHNCQTSKQTGSAFVVVRPCLQNATERNLRFQINQSTGTFYRNYFLASIDSWEWKKWGKKICCSSVGRWADELILHKVWSAVRPNNLQNESSIFWMEWSFAPNQNDA